MAAKLPEATTSSKPCIEHPLFAQQKGAPFSRSEKEGEAKCRGSNSRMMLEADRTQSFKASFTIATKPSVFSTYSCASFWEKELFP